MNTTADINDRLSHEVGRLKRIARDLGRIEADFREIADDALETLWDGYGYDPRSADDYSPECEDLAATQADAEELALTVRNLRAIFDAIV